jgi:hypothetical protein
VQDGGLASWPRTDVARAMTIRPETMSIRGYNACVRFTVLFAVVGAAMGLGLLNVAVAAASSISIVAPSAVSRTDAALTVTGTADGQAGLFVVQGPPNQQCSESDFRIGADGWVALTDSLNGIAVTGAFSESVPLDTGSPGAFTICAMLWNGGLRTPAGPQMATATAQVVIKQAPPPPTDPRVTGLSSHATTPGGIESFAYETANSVSDSNGQGRDQREVITLIRRGAVVSRSVTPWHVTPETVIVHMRAPAKYVGPYQWCVRPQGRDGRFGPTRCGRFSTHLPPKPRGGGGSSGGGTGGGNGCMVGPVALQLLGVDCPAAKIVYEDFVSRVPLPQGWDCAGRRCEGPPDFTGIRITFTW